MTKTFLGYRRAQGRAGVRNWIAVISVMDNCNPVTRAISQAVAGTIPVTAMFVRGQFGADLDFALGALAGMGRNPNIAGVLLVGREPAQAQRLVPPWAWFPQSEFLSWPLPGQTPLLWKQSTVGKQLHCCRSEPL